MSPVLTTTSKGVAALEAGYLPTWAKPYQLVLCFPLSCHHNSLCLPAECGFLLSHIQIEEGPDPELPLM